MEWEQESTDYLMGVLQNAQQEDIDEYDRRYLVKQRVGFSGYMDSIIKRKKLRRQDIFQKADLPQKYGYKLLRGETHTTDRDKLLRIFIAMNMTLKETQRALSLYGMPQLYAKKKRDAMLINAFNKGMSSVDDVNEYLAEKGEEELSRSSG